MNLDNLHTIINRYENDLEAVYVKDANELFKWRAIKGWQDAFHSSDVTGSFKEKFNSAKKTFSYFIDNGYQHPSTGIMKLWEKEPETIERLFTDVLLSDSCNNAQDVQQSMQSFLSAYENLRIKYYPEALSYKLTPHIVSVFMTMDHPAVHYVFRVSAARKMARYIGYKEDIGSATEPNIVNYYKMCDIIVAALKEHPSLQEKHFSYLTDDMYRDESLHMMVFDLMHCSGYRGYYTGLMSSDGNDQKRRKYTGPSAEEMARKEQERLERIAELEQSINELELSIEDFEDISLVGVEVHFPQYGTGKVVEQKINKIVVQFPEVRKGFLLDKEYKSRPQFENDKEIVEILTVYGRTCKKLDELKKELQCLQRE